MIESPSQGKESAGEPEGVLAKARWYDLWKEMLSPEALSGKESGESGLTYKGINQATLRKSWGELPILTFSSQKPGGALTDVSGMKREGEIPGQSPGVNADSSAQTFSGGITADEIHLPPSEQRAAAEIGKARDTFSGQATMADSPAQTFSGGSTADEIPLPPSDRVVSSRAERAQESLPAEAGTPSTLATNYELYEELARGGMGIVYRARQKNLKREIAVKKIPPSRLNPESREKFLSEALVTAYLNHPNIVPIHDLGQSEEGEVILAMKLVGGISWKDLLHPQREEEKRRAEGYDRDGHLRILLQVCNAVAFAHSREIVHCDLKPENVMVGEFGEVLVMDWGIAVDIGERRAGETRVLHRSQITSPLGTPSYMPAELVEGRGADIGPWTDVYLLGAMLCEILRGTPPRTGNSLAMVLLSAYQGKLPELGDVPSELRTICHQALAHKPGDRYRSVAEFQQALQGYLTHQQSIVISEEAQELLDRCWELGETICGKREAPERESNRIYGNFAQAVAGFGQALKLWKGNEAAREGQHRARLAYAEVALANGDLGLAQAQATELEESRRETAPLREKIQEARESQRRRQRATERLRRGFTAAVAAIVLGLLVGFLWIRAEQQETLREKGRAEANAQDAMDKQEEALRQKERAEANEQKAQKSEQSAREADRVKAIQLTHIALSKAGEVWDQREWAKSGAYSGEALEFVKDLEGSDVEKLREQGRGGVRMALQNVRLLWKTPWGGVSPFQALAWSPDGLTLASGSKDTTVRLWEVATGRKLSTLQGHTEYVTSVAFSPAGLTLASGSWDKTVMLWEVATGRLPQRMAQLHTRGSILEAKFFSSPWDFRIDIPGWQMERDLAQQPRQTTRTLFEWQVREDLSLETYTSVPLLWDRLLTPAEAREPSASRGTVQYYQEEIAACDEQLRRQPGLVPALLRRGLLYWQLGEGEKAWADGLSAATLAPEQAEEVWASFPKKALLTFSQSIQGVEEGKRAALLWVLNRQLWQSYRRNQCAEIPEHACVALRQSGHRPFLDTAAAIYASQGKREEAERWAIQALPDTPLRVEWLGNGLRPQQVEDQLPRLPLADRYLLLLAYHKRRGDQSKLEQWMAKYRKAQAGDSFAWKILAYYTGSLKELWALAQGPKAGEKTPVESTEENILSRGK